MSHRVLRCAGVGVRYGAIDALAAIDVEVGSGELLAVLGPSGSGKTTLLHAVAGFVPLSAGSIEVGGRTVADRDTSVPPEHRNVGVVFQHHALWPHLTVAQTVAFPLQRAGTARSDIDVEVGRLLDRLGIGHLADRRPAELSGGEQQRVSLGRALARHPALFLFDEPTAHLDAPLRMSLLEEIDRQRRLEGTAGIYATHDAAEALALADRVLVLRAGRAVQVGTPLVVYEQPVDRWAAELTGPASVLEAAVTPTTAGRARVALGGVQREIELTGHPGGVPLLRPEWVSLGGPLAGVVDRVWYRGSRTEYRLRTTAGNLVVGEDGPPRLAAGDETGWDLRRAHLVSRH
jgi:ABC-type Fe3+/spermidine/putrescine transport system ATPase subunit